MCLEVSSSRFETYPGCFSFSRNTPCHGWPEHHERDAPSKSILNHPCYESNCLCARIKAREGGIVLEEHLKSTAKNVRMGREYAPHAGESSGISAALSCSRRENQLRSFIPARESLIHRKGRSVLHRQGSSQTWKGTPINRYRCSVEGERGSLSRFEIQRTRLVRLESRILSRRSMIQRTFSRTFELDSINRHILPCDGMAHVSIIVEDREDTKLLL